MALPGTPGQRISDLCNGNHITQKQLAKKIGVSASQLSRIVSGETKTVSSDILIGVAKEFKVSTDYILGLSNISVRKSYDISELGLSEGTIKGLVTGTVDVQILNRLLEHKNFPKLMDLIRIYFQDTAAKGIMARNRLIELATVSLSDLMKEHPEHRAEAKQDLQFLNAQKMGEHEAEIEKIKNVFLAILRDIKKDMDNGEQPGDAVTAAMFQTMQETMKDHQQEPLSMDDVTAMIVGQIGQLLPMDEETAGQFQQLAKKIIEQAEKGENSVAQSEIKKIIGQLKKKEIRVFDVPKEYENDIQIVTFERKAGLRITGKKGFDIISNTFFVEEVLIHIDIDGEEHKRGIFISFDNFDSYFDFLNGDIYDNACYAFYHLPEHMVTSRKIDLKRLMERRAFIEDTIDNYSLSVSNDEIVAYKNAEQTHKQCQQWVRKFNNCNSYDELVKVVSNYYKSKIATIVDVTFFFFQYIFADVENKNRFDIIMEYMSSGAYPQYKIINSLCSIYNPDEVMQSFGATGTIYKHKRKLKEYIQRLENGEIEFYSKAFFDKETHYFCEKTDGYDKGNTHFPRVTICRYFESFDEFIIYRKGDLRHCDLSAMFECNEDFSKYIIDETTKLPIHIDMEVTYSVKKYYHDGKFYVIQKWLNKSGSILKEYNHTFKYFFDFVVFLKGNLSNADLLFCDGLDNLAQWDFIDFTGAKMKSNLCEKFGLQYDTYAINLNAIESFECIEKNESETALVLQSSRDLVSEAAGRDLSNFDLAFDNKCQRVYYISDIHLMHRIQNVGCSSKEDIVYVVQKIVDTIANETGRLLLIGGDVASDFEVFQLFVKLLYKSLRRNTLVVFTLGNHELWSFPNLTIDEIVMKYRAFLEEYGMYLLHNDILYKEDCGLLADPNTGTYLIKYHDLCQMNETQIADRLRSARYVILGGLGFSGYNMEFNADNGIYQMTMDRTTEIKESKIFEDLYNRLCPILANKNTIILTHTPKKDWCREADPDKNYVYVSGHTHRNFFHDDGEYRVYSDNQVGYHSENPHLKTFLLDNDYDCFSDYEDGIFEVTGEQYNDFYRGKNISMTFQREVNVLYMLKKNGYYCFIHKSRSGSLTILNGGAMKKLEIQDVQYYYDNMDAMISTIKTPLDKFTSFQKRVADMVKRIGGVGTIHGSIIDIDFYNHIYVNPLDLSITGYWASDIINKVVYPSIPALLEKKCPTIFGEYVKLLKGNGENQLAPKQQANIEILPQIYLDTDMYKASREIKKMQKLSSNILTSWYEDTLHKKPQIELT